MKKRGYALPLSLCVAGVTLMLGFSAAQMTNGDLSLANHQYYQERARQMADFGLEFCVSHQVTPGTVVPLNSLSAAHPFDTVSVQMYQWDTPGAPIAVPKGFEYWVAEGRCSENSSSGPLASARVGALVRYGLPAGSAGAQVRSMAVRAESAVDYIVQDGVTGQSVPNESVCSSDYDGGVGPPLPFPNQFNVIDLGPVGRFEGNFRIPRGVPKSVVHFDPGATVPVSQDGGPLNVPTFSPPSGLPFVSGLALPSGFDGVLPAGHYASLEIPPNANVHLKGTYHFDNLNLSSDTGAGQGGTLRVDSTDSAKVFVTHLNLGQGSLGLTNAHGSAQNFRFTLQAARSASSTPPPLLNFKLFNGGGVALVADGHRIHLEADSSSEIRGAFSALALEVKFPSGGSPLTPSRFIYDVSATTARRAGKGGIGAGNGGGGDDGYTNTIGDVSGVGGTGGETVGEPESGDDGHGVPRTRDFGDDPTQARPAGLEPMILSRQPL